MSYFEKTDCQYYDPKYIIAILETMLESKLDEIKNSIYSAQVIVTENQIREFLAKKFEEENPDVKNRIELYEIKRKENIAYRESEKEIFGYCLDHKLDIDESSLEFRDKLIASRYSFDPYTLEYFHKYSRILRDNSLLLLNIIEKIGTNEIMPISSLMDELDIALDERGISKEDILRLIEPTIYNINTLNEKIRKANDLTTYLTFKISLQGLIEEDLYPSSSLQVKKLNYDYSKGNVPLSKKQKIKLKKRFYPTIQALINYNDK